MTGTGTQGKSVEQYRAIPIASGDASGGSNSDAERELYLTDAYRQVAIHTEQAGETTLAISVAT